jgi:hypothetical protein
MSQSCPLAEVHGLGFDGFLTYGHPALQHCPFFLQKHARLSHLHLASIATPNR